MHAEARETVWNIPASTFFRVRCPQRFRSYTVEAFLKA